MKTILLWTLALFMLAAPGAAEAITVSIQATRGATTVTLPSTAFPAALPTFTDSAGRSSVALACTAQTGANSPVGTTACTRTILINNTVAVTIKDISTTNRARVYRDDGQSSDILNVAGILAISGSLTNSTTNVMTLTISYSSNEFTKLNYNSYSYTATMSGNFFSSSGGVPTACNSAAAPCLTQKLTANNIGVNQFGDNAIATVNVPPFANTSGGFGPSTNPSETKSIPCGIPTNATTGLPVQPTCTPTLVGSLTAISKAANDTLKLTGGAPIAGSHRPTTAGGVTDTFVDGAVPEFVNDLVPVNIVRYDQAATLHAALVQDGLLFPKAGGSGQMPLWWNLEKVDGFTQTDATVLKSIVSNGNPDLFDDGAYVSAVPTNLKGTQPRDLTSLVAVYAAPTGCSGPLPSNFFFVEIQLKTTPVKAIRVLLDCGDLSTQNLVTFPGVIVKLPDGSNTNWKGMLNQFGGVDIRSISVFLTPIFNPVPVDQEVSLDSLTFVAFKTTFTQSGGQTPTFAPTNLVKCVDFPGLNEFTVRATPVDANGQPVGASFIWGDAPGETFQKVPTTGEDCQLRTAIPINDFPPHVRQNAWRFDLLYNLVPSGFGTLIVAENN